MSDEKKMSADEKRRLKKRRSFERTRRQNFRIGLLAMLLSLIALYLAFAGLPFKGGYTISAIATSSNQLKKNSPVRIAGVLVGKVSKIEKGPGATAKISMRLQKSALPIHTDATLKIRPRLFLEGNFFVDLTPGTPSAPTLEEHGTIPLSQTAVPVQFDQVLTALQANTRVGLQHVLKQYSTALNDGGALAVRRAYKPSEGAFKGVALLSQEARGLTQDDISQFLKSTTTVTTTLNGQRGELQGLLTNFNRTVTALADESDNVGRSTRLLADVTEEAYPALGTINASLPSLRRLAIDARPLVRRLPRTLDLTLPLLDQLDRLVDPAELPALVSDAKPTLNALASLEPRLTSLLDQVTPVSQCVTSNVLPVLNAKVPDGDLSSGTTVFQEFGAAGVGLASASQDFDGNGPAVRLLAGGGEQTVATGQAPGLGTLTGTLFSNPQNPIIGSRPARPATHPPYRPDVPCKGQKVADLNADTHQATSTRTVSPPDTTPTAQTRALLSGLTQLAAKPGATARADVVKVEKEAETK